MVAGSLISFKNGKKKHSSNKYICFYFNRRGTSFKRGGHLRRTLSNDQDQEPGDTGEGGIGATPDLETQVSVPPLSGGGVSQPTAPTVTVIRIGDGTNEVNLPYVLQDRGRAPTSGNWALRYHSYIT